MSIRINPEKAVPLLPKGLTNAIQNHKGFKDDVPKAKRIHKIEDDLSYYMEGLYPELKQLERKLLDHFTKLERCLLNSDSYSTIKSLLDSVEDEITNIKKSVSQHERSLRLLLTGKASKDEIRSNGHKKESGNEDIYVKGPKLSTRSSSLSSMEKEILEHPTMTYLRASNYDRLDRIQLRICLLFLSVFPANAVIKRRPLIYWWIGEGLIKTEEEGEEIFQELLKVELIRPYVNSKFPIVNKCQLHPWIRYMLISVAKEAQLFDFDSQGVAIIGTNINHSRRACLVYDVGLSSAEIENSSKYYEDLRTIFNVDENCIDFSSAEWLADLRKLAVLQLGRLQLPKYHIKVESEGFLNYLRTQKLLKYLSLRGVSSITVLPPSIVELVNLEILDLKACSNLKRLPPHIGPLRKLTHLDVSECYLLESMPMGLDKLRSLQVLKGFITGMSDKKTSCKIGDLKSLDKLKRLSVHIESEAVGRDFNVLKDLRQLKCLTISWGVASQILEDNQTVAKQSFSFPPYLEQLCLEGLPTELPEWLKPSKLRVLKKLYIKGGKKISSLVHAETDKWTVEILRLKYLEKLKIDLPEVKRMFPNLTYVRSDEFEWREEASSKAGSSRS